MKNQTQMVTQIRYSNCNKNQKRKYWQDLKTHNATNLKAKNVKKLKILIVTKLSNSKVDNSKKENERKNEKTEDEILTKIRYSNCDKSPNIKLWRKKLR